MNLIKTLIRRSGLKQLILLSLFFSPVCTWAQNDTTKYDYARFRFPDINRRALDFSGSFGGSLNDNRLRESGTTVDRGSLGHNLDVSYSQFINRDKLQATRDIALYNNYDFKSEKTVLSNATVFVRESHFAPSLLSSGVNRYYVRPNKYVQVDWNVSGSYNQRKIRSSSNPTDLQQGYSFNFSIPLRFGVGRIEPIDDIFLAKFMMDDMQENSVLQAPLAQEDLFELGRIMAHARNQRIFDFRRQRIFELDKLDEWFRSKGVARTGELIYFTTLTDNWLYAFRNTRFAGKRFSVGLAPNYRGLGSPGNSPSIQYGLRFLAGYENQRPLNQFWQFDYEISFNAQYQDSNTDLLGLFQNFFSVGGSGGINLGYYPNSRTRINLSGRLAPSYRISSEPLSPAGTPNNNVVILSQAGAGLDYFLNFRTRLQFNLNTSYQWSSSKIEPPQTIDIFLLNNSNFFLSSQLRLVYSLF